MNQWWKSFGKGHWFYDPIMIGHYSKCSKFLVKRFLQIDKNWGEISEKNYVCSLRQFFSTKGEK